MALRLLPEGQAADFRGTVSSSTDLLDYARLQNIQVTYQEPFSAPPVVIFEHGSDAVSVKSLTNGFLAGTIMRPIGKGDYPFGRSSYSDIRSAFRMIDGGPACLYSDTKQGLMLARLASIDGKPVWTRTSVDSTFSWSYVLALFSIGDRPAAAYLNPEAASISLAVAANSQGRGPWRVQATGLKISTNSWFSMAAGEFESRPVLVYIGETNSLMFAIAADAEGNGPWKRVPAPGGSFSAVHGSLHEIDGRPAFIRTEDVPGLLYLTTAADAQGSSWQSTLIDTNAYGASLAVIDGSVLIAYAQRVWTPCNGGLCDQTRLRLARRSPGAESWSIMDVGEGGGQTSITQAGGRVVISFYWVNRLWGAGGAFVSADDQFDQWLRLPDNQGVVEPLQSMTASAKEQAWFDWNGSPCLIVTGDNSENGIYTLPEVYWRAVEGPYATIKLGTRFFAEAAGSPYKIAHRAVPWTGRDIRLATGDWNQDGKIDIAEADSTTSSCRLLQGDGRGGLEMAWSDNVGFPVDSIAPINFPSGGKPGLIVSGDEVLTYLPGPGGFVLDQRFSSRQPARGYNAPLSFSADLNRDGMADYVMVWLWSGGGYISVFLGGGADSGNGRSTYPFENAALVATADLNRDGIPDIVIVSGGLLIALSDGQGGFDFRRPAAPLFSGSSTLAAGDLNGDGITDIAVADGPEIHALIGDDSANFRPQLVYRGDPQQVPITLLAADLNNDGRADIVAGYNNGFGAAVLLNDGKLGFNPAPGSPYPCGDVPNSIVTADLNRDGLPDLIVGDSHEMEIHVLLGGGMGNSMTIDFTGLPSAKYRVEWTDSLTHPVWRDHLTLTAGPDGRFRCPHQSASAQVFYRAIQIP